MNRQDLITKINDLKGTVQNLFGQRVHHFFKREIERDEEDKSHEGLDHGVEDLPLTLSRDASPGVTFYPTENSEFSRGMPKEIPRGLDSFGEQDTFDFEEADDYQTNRDRKQNSDLSKRFYTSGLHLDD